MYFNRKTAFLYLVIFSVIISVIVPGAGRTSASTKFKDVPQTFWAHDAIHYLTALDIIKGYQEADGTSTFKPENHVTRAQAAIMFVKALDPNDEGKVVDKPTFPDVPLDHFASRFIERAFELGIFKGRENGNFSPQDPITKAQMSAVISNVFPLNRNLVVASSFNDVSKTHWAYETINLLHANGIITHEASFKPEADTSRAQFSVYLTNSLHIAKIKEYPVAKGQVTATNLNIRELPSTTAKILGKIPNGQEVHIYGELNEWFVIKHNEKQAYIASEFVNNVEMIESTEQNTEEQEVVEANPDETEGEPETATNPNEQTPQIEHEIVIANGVVTATSLNVRETPSLSGNVVGSLANGRVVSIYSIDGDWAKIRYENEYRYIHKGFLSITPIEGDKIIGKTIVIDPGHGGGDPGAEGFGIIEKEVILDVSLRLREKLKAAGVNVIMTRETDTFVSLEKRVQIANNSSADSFVSIHANAFTDQLVNGTETYWNNTFTSKQSETLAKDIQNELLFVLNTADRGVKHGNFQVIKQSRVPSVLIELAFVTNQQEAELMASSDFREKAAQAIFQGVVNYYNKQ